MERSPNHLMSGEVRTPTVFTENRVIAQRHFNAVALARFLRIKVANERMLGGIKQQIRLEAFLPPDSRANIPEGWFQMRPATLHLNFLEWLGTQSEGDIFQTQAGRSLLRALGDFDAGKRETMEAYERVLRDIAEELSALMTERQKLFRQGDSPEDIDRAVKNLLGSDVIAIMAERGFLPRYAFPLSAHLTDPATANADAFY